MNDPIGSQWRKWDLHFHTPSSYDYENKSVTNKDITETLKGRKISVVAITDHHVIDVDRINELQGLVGDDLTVLPGIELCAESRGSEPIHFIGIFPENCNIKYIWNEINSKAEIAEQKENGKSDDEIYCPLKDTTELIRHLGGIVSIHAGRKSNSIEKITNSLPVKMAEKKDIAKYIDIFELGQEKDQEDYTQKVFPQIGVYPMIICSDNHNAKKYKPKQSCWIKADPTFEGLRQIIYEPYERVKIQNSNPENDYRKTIISNLNIDSSSKFPIPNQEVRFNRNMVSIIGGRGSGKSVLLKTIAHFNRLGGEFIEDIRKDGGSADFEMNLLNKDGDGENISSQIESHDSHNLPIFYIPQNSLVNEAKNEDKVRSNVLSHIGLADVLVKYSDLIEQAESLHSQLIDKENAKQEIYEKLSYDPKEHGTFTAFINKKMSDAKEKKKRYSTEKTQQLIEDITSIFSEGQLLRKWSESSEFDEIITNIETSNRLIGFYNKKIDSINEKSNVELTKLPLLNFTDIQEKNDENSSKVKSRLKVLRESFVKKKKELEKAGIRENATNLTNALKDIEEEITTLNQHKDNHDSFNQEIDSLRGSLSELFYDEDDSIPIRTEETKSYIDTLFEKFIEERNDSKLFGTMFKGVKVKGQIKFEWEKLKEHLRECFYKDSVDVEKIIFGSRKISQNNFTNWVATGRIWETIDKQTKYFKEEYDRKNKLDGKNAFISFIFAKWDRFIKVTPSIEGNYQGKLKELSEMSIGEQSTLLLKFKLATEGLKSQIIILDQPEDNLDNDFITNELENLMKEIKKHKQLIIATHNANLVVGADSEEIIVARLDQRLYANKNYLSGSIENPRIRDEIITILEGGKDAFEKRRKKLQLSQ